MSFQDEDGLAPRALIHGPVHQFGALIIRVYIQSTLILLRGAVFGAVMNPRGSKADFRRVLAK
jgi:hypothetical protein